MLTDHAKIRAAEHFGWSPQTAANKASAALVRGASSRDAGDSRALEYLKITANKHASEGVMEAMREELGIVRRRRKIEKRLRRAAPLIDDPTAADFRQALGAMRALLREIDNPRGGKKIKFSEAYVAAETFCRRWEGYTRNQESPLTEEV